MPPATPPACEDRTRTSSLRPYRNPCSRRFSGVIRGWTNWRMMVELFMPLAPGTRFEPYKIVASSGAGGMGGAYRARETRLNRIVAIKVIPEHLSQAKLRERHEREARRFPDGGQQHRTTHPASGGQAATVSVTVQ